MFVLLLMPHLAGLIRQRTTCQLQCEQAGRNNKLASPPYAIHNMDITTKKRRHSIETDIVSVTASGSLDASVARNVNCEYAACMLPKQQQLCAWLEPGPCCV
jgi:hypothetical protein